MSELLMDSRDDFAVETIVANWEYLRGTPVYVQAALYLATPETVALAQAAVHESGDIAGMLRFVDQHWGFKTVDRVGVTDVAQLRALEPFYGTIAEGQFGDLTISHFFEIANRLGALGWRKTHLDPLTTVTARGHCPSEPEALYASLDAEVAIYLKYDRDYFAIDLWFRRREEELWSREALLVIIGEWALARADVTAIKLLCEALIRFGERSDLGIFDSLSPEVREACRDAIINCDYDVRRRSLGD